MPRPARRAAGLTLAVALAAVPAPAVAWTFDWAGRVEVDAEGLQSEDASKRYAAVAELSKYDIALTEAHLLRALSDPDERIRLQAAKALGQGGSAAAVRPMIEWLASPEPKVRATAVTALGAIGGAEATTALTRSLSDPDSNVRRDTVRALGAVGRKGTASVIVALIPRLEDDKSDVRLATIGQLEELGDRRAVIPLVARFGDTGVAVRAAAVRAIGKLGDRSATPALIRLTSDPDEGVRSAAVAALGALGAIDALDTLAEQLATGGDSFRSKVALALGQIAAAPGAGSAGENAMRTLVAALAQPQLQRAAAREALRVAGKAAVPALVAHLQGRLAGDPATAVDLLAEARDPRATSTLAAELERGRVAMPAVLRALGATGDAAALVPVLRALASPDVAIRLAALAALRPLLGRDARAGDVLVEHLTDPDLEVRVLAVEYLGLLRLGAAAPRLAALTGPEQPARLRRAAIDALGELGRPESSAPLIAVLRDGPPELHRAAAAALARIADPAALAFLVARAASDRSATRPELVRAIGAALRGRDHVEARALLRKLAVDAPTRVSLAAIGGLAAAGAGRAADAAVVDLLRELAATAGADRRRAAAAALGALRDAGSIEALASALGTRDDPFAADAAWALGEILAAAPRDARGPRVADRWLHVAGRGGWAASISSAGALARWLWQLPRAERRALLTPDRRGALLALRFQRSRLVRINVAHALASLTGDRDAAAALGQLAREDPSPAVRIAAARALMRHGGDEPVATSDAAPGPRDRTAGALVRAAAEADPESSVRDALLAIAAAPPPPLVPRTEWRTYHVVDPAADDAPVRYEPYFVHDPDGVVWATYTDARGELTTEHAPPGDAIVAPASRESEY